MDDLILPGTSLDKPFENADISKDTVMSGNAYVSMRLPGDRRWSKIPFASTKRCGHLNRVCVNCARIWMRDWTVNWEATGAGRRIKQILSEHNITVD